MGVIYIRAIERNDIDGVVKLHQTQIIHGFASYLGKPFLRLLYENLVGSDTGIGLVAVSGEGDVVGFVSGTTKLAAFYRSFLKKYGLKAVITVLPKVFRVSVFKSIFQTLFYVSENKKEQNLPDAEIISVVVSPNYQGQGIARRLVIKILEEFKKRNSNKVKVLVGDKLEANEFYKKMGFEFIRHIAYNSDKMDANLYVIGTVGDD
jgi:ribosomal protein S18 acetylase RimI-like enzyme